MKYVHNSVRKIQKESEVYQVCTSCCHLFKKAFKLLIFSWNLFPIDPPKVFSSPPPRQTVVGVEPNKLTI